MTPVKSLNIKKLSCFIVLVVTTLISLDIAWLFNELYIRQVRMDDSRLIIATVQPWVDGTFTLSNLWSDHHPAPISGLLYILSFELESLNFRSWKLLIGLFIFLEVVAFSFLVWRSSHTSYYTKLLLVLIVFLILLSSNSSIRYEWNLVGVFHFYHALAVPLLLSFGRLNRQVNLQSMLLLSTFILVNLLVFRSFALFWLTSLLGVVFFRFLLLKLNDNKFFLTTLVAVVLAALVEHSFFKFFEIELNANSISLENLVNSFQVWGQDPFNALGYIITSLATGLINPSILADRELSTSVTNPIWVSVGIAYISAMVVAVYRLKDSQYIIPLILMSFSLLTIIAAMILRVQANHTDMFSSYWPRYIPMRDIGFIGVFWVAAIEIQRAQRLSFLLKFFLTPMAISGLFALLMIYHSFAHDRIKYLKVYNQREQNAMVFIGQTMSENDTIKFGYVRAKYRQEHQSEMPYWYIRNIPDNQHSGNNIHLMGINFLRKRSLNVFSDNYD